MQGLVNADEYLPLREVVFKTLRQAILKGEMKPGERLMEVSLAKKLGVSRTPVREAIRKLELEGLVLMMPRRGAEVAGITEKSLTDVLEVRKVLEELAIELACKRMTKEEVRMLEVAANSFKIAVGKAEPIEIAGSDEAFHDIIFNGTGNDKLVLLLNNLREQMYRYRLEYVKDPRQWKPLMEEHDKILNAIKNRDELAAKEILKTHIDNQEIEVAKNIKLGLG